MKDQSLIWIREKINFLVLFVIILFSPAAFATGGYNPFKGCGGTYLENALSALRINPAITTNGQFLSEVGRRYGSKLTDAMISAHPVLKKADKSIDVETVKWMLKKFMLADNKEVRRAIMLPFELNSDKPSLTLFMNLLVSETWPDVISVPFFINEAQRDALKSFFRKYDYENAVNSFKKVYGVDFLTAREMAKTLYKKVFEEKNYRVGFGSIGPGEGMITVLGHGIPGSDSLTLAGIRKHVDEIVDDVMSSGLPKTANIEVAACYGACGKLGALGQTNLSAEELKQAFLNKTIQDHIGKREESFGYMFSSTLFEKYPEFEGRVIAYNGIVSIPPAPALVRDPLDPEKLITQVTYAVGVRDNSEDSRVIWFDMNEMYQVYLKSEFVK